MNVWGIECPECIFQSDRLTAAFGLINDKVYHRMKFYIKCRCCGLTTAAYTDPRETIDHWDTYFVKKEDKILLKEDVEEDDFNLESSHNFGKRGLTKRKRSPRLFFLKRIKSPLTSTTTL